MRPDQGLPSYPCMGNDWFYLRHVGGRPYRIQKLQCSTLCRSKLSITSRTVFFHSAPLPPCRGTPATVAAFSARRQRRQRYRRMWMRQRRLRQNAAEDIRSDVLAGQAATFLMTRRPSGSATDTSAIKKSRFAPGFFIDASCASTPPGAAVRGRRPESGRPQPDRWLRAFAPRGD